MGSRRKLQRHDYLLSFRKSTRGQTIHEKLVNCWMKQYPHKCFRKEVFWKPRITAVQPLPPIPPSAHVRSIMRILKLSRSVTPSSLPILVELYLVNAPSFALSPSQLAHLSLLHTNPNFGSANVRRLSTISPGILVCSPSRPSQKTSCSATPLALPNLLGGTISFRVDVNLISLDEVVSALATPVLNGSAYILS